MPTRRLGQVRRWLASGRAQFVRRTPFTIRLLDREGGFTQPLQAGVDLGTAHVAVSVFSEKAELFAAEFRLRTDLSRLLTQRRQFRRARRSRKVRHRKPRFLNRKRKDPLAPSVRAKVEGLPNTAAGGRSADLTTGAKRTVTRRERRFLSRPAGGDLRARTCRGSPTRWRRPGNCPASTTRKNCLRWPNAWQQAGHSSRDRKVDPVVTVNGEVVPLRTASAT
jgi:hypothetical protein